MQIQLGHPSICRPSRNKGHNLSLYAQRLHSASQPTLFSPSSGLRTLPPFCLLLNVPLVDDLTDCGANQEGYEYSLSSKDKDWSICFGEVLPPIPKKLAEHIWQRDGELLPETRNLKPGDEENQQRLLTQRKKPVTELKTWVQCFAIYVGVVSMKNPEFTPDMMACMVMIVKTMEEYAGLAWVQYDKVFLRQANSKERCQWSKVNPSLFAQCLTRRAHNTAHCYLCLSSSHTTQDCALGNTTNNEITSAGLSLLKYHSWQSPTNCGGSRYTA